MSERAFREHLLRLLLRGDVAEAIRALQARENVESGPFSLTGAPKLGVLG